MLQLCFIPPLHTPLMLAFPELICIVCLFSWMSNQVKRMHKQHVATLAALRSKNFDKSDAVAKEGNCLEVFPHKLSCSIGFKANGDTTSPQINKRNRVSYWHLYNNVQGVDFNSSFLVYSFQVMITQRLQLSNRHQWNDSALYFINVYLRKNVDKKNWLKINKSVDKKMIHLSVM